MNEPEAVIEFKQGLSLLRNEYPDKALPHLRKAVELDTKNSFYLSYLGLALAKAGGKWEKAEELCSTAVRMNRTQAELYINLCEIYRLAGKRQDAIETLDRGLQLTKRDARLVKALSKFGMRRPPVLSFLDRQHFLNRQLGRLRHRTMKSFGKEV